MTVTTQAALLGAVLGAACWLILGRILPAQPALADSMNALAGSDTDDDAGRSNFGSATDDFPSKVGARLYPYLAEQSWITNPAADLAILQMTVSRHLGSKILSALVGLALPVVLQAMLTLTGASVPISIPLFGSLILAGILFIAPDIEVRSKAAKARGEFSRSLGAFMEFVVLNRRGGVGSTQSLERAASVGNSWVFQRIAAELDKAALVGKLPWTHLERLSLELGLPELEDLVKTMTLTGEQGASVSDNLAATASTLRNEHLSKELGDAGSATTKMQAPLAVMAVIFIGMLVIAAAANVMSVGI